MGRATARLFANEGNLLALTDINEAGLACVPDEISSEGANARTWRLDVLDHDDIRRMVNEAAHHFGACAKGIAVRQCGVIGASRQGAGIQRATVQKSA